MISFNGISEHGIYERGELMHVDCFPGGMQFLSRAYFKCLPYICLKYICANSGEISYKTNVRYNRTIYFFFPPLANNQHLIKTFGGCCKTNILILHQRVKGLMTKKKKKMDRTKSKAHKPCALMLSGDFFT